LGEGLARPSGVRFKVLRNSVNWGAMLVGVCGGGG
jgi:hypothetical protein